MTPLLTVLLIFATPNAFAMKTLDPKDVPWLEDLKQAKAFFFHICGSADILPTQKSLNKDFAFGQDAQGYFFTGTPGLGEYWSTIREQKLEEAKRALQARFEKAHLWRHSKKGLVDLGVPTKIELPFLATIKDCMDGAKNSMGFECKPGDYRASCCSEKFWGPRIFWGANQEYILKFSPDPSVKLKVPGESKNRYCNFQQTIEVKGSGR